jgi:hypothetical protein
VELSADLANASNLRWKIQGDQLLPTSIRSDGGDGSVFDVVIERYAALCQRSEDMIVRLVTVEVENDLKQHLQRYVTVNTIRVTAVLRYCGAARCTLHAAAR